VIGRRVRSSTSSGARGRHVFRFVSCRAVNQSPGFCYDFEQCICDKPVLAFGTERITIVNSRRLSSQRSQRSVRVEFGELSKECLARGIVLGSLRAK
jgi:hypothetical protein